MRLLALCNVLALLALIPHTAVAVVLAIDYGSDWIKASVMSPGGVGWFACAGGSEKR